MSNFVQLDTLAGLLAFHSISQALLAKWLEQNPDEAEISNMIDHLRDEIKNIHSENSMSAEMEVTIVERALFHLDTYFQQSLGHRGVGGDFQRDL